MIGRHSSSSSLLFLLWTPLIALAIIIISTSNALKEPSAYIPIHIPNHNHRSSLSRTISRNSIYLQSSSSSSSSSSLLLPPRIIFPGGGLFFYWQAGAICHLRDSGYDLSCIKFSGASAGSLVATLTATNVDFIKATEYALDLSERAGVWDRPLGLQGIWGGLIETWLNDLLPENALDMVQDRVSLLVTPIPSFGKSAISHFSSRDDLIQCNMASIHIPWFLDGKLTSNFRNRMHIDGSFFAEEKHYFLNEPSGSEDDTTTKAAIQLNWKMDPIMAEKANDIVKVISKEGIWGMLEQGRSYAKLMESQGAFEMIPKL